MQWLSASESPQRVDLASGVDGTGAYERTIVCMILQHLSGYVKVAALPAVA